MSFWVVAISIWVLPQVLIAIGGHIASVRGAFSTKKPKEDRFISLAKLPAIRSSVKELARVILTPRPGRYSFVPGKKMTPSSAPPPPMHLSS
jgi:hypothetical protein